MKKIKILNDITVAYTSKTRIVIKKDTVIRDYKLIREHIPVDSHETPIEHYHNIEIEVYNDIFVYELKIWRNSFEWIE